MNVMLVNLKRNLINLWEQRDFSLPYFLKYTFVGEEKYFRIMKGTTRSFQTWTTTLPLCIGIISPLLYAFSSGYRVMIPSILGVAETSFEIPSQRAFDTGYDSDNSSNVLVATDTVQLSTQDGWWDTSYVARKQVTLKNLSAETLDATSSVQVTINTKELFDAGRLQADCDDLRITHDDAGTHSEISRSFSVAEGAIDCSDSTATIVTVPLQANILMTETDANYYVYYGNDSASAPSSQDDGYNIGSANALLVCPFNGTTTCIDGETPSTETGAIRYETGSAMEFDGEDDTLSVPHSSSLAINGDLAISLWVNFSHSAGLKGIINKRSGAIANGWTLSWSSNGKIYFYTGDGNNQNNIASNSSYTTSGWHHVVALINSDTMELYIDGVIQTETNSSLLVDNNSAVTIGNFRVGMPTSYLLTGLIDEVAIYDRALTLEEIQAHYNSGSPVPIKTDSSTKLLLHFDENGDDPRNTGKAIDSSGNGNHGTINGAKYTTGSPVPNQSYASHEGIFIEEGTTNLVNNCQPKVEMSGFLQSRNVLPSKLN